MSPWPRLAPPGCTVEELRCGYDLDVWRDVAVALKLTEGEDFVYTCLGETGFDDMIADLERDEPRSGNLCDVGVGAITATVERSARGLQFSKGIYRGNLAVMIQASRKRSGTWAFFSPLHWTVWVAVLGTALVVSILVLVLEQLLSGRSAYLDHKDAHNLVVGLKEAMWHSTSFLFQVDSFSVNSSPSRIVVLGYAFMVTIVMATYTANLAAFLTVDRLEASIKNVNDLVGQAVATTSLYVSRLKQNYRITATDAFGLRYYDMRDALLRGDIKAVVAADTQLITMVRNDTTCRLFLLDDTIVPYDISFGFSKDAPADLIAAVNEQILALQESGQMQRLQDQHLPPEGNCNAASDTSVPTQVSLSSLSGLWFIIMALVVLALAIALIHYWREARRAESAVTQRFAQMREILSKRRKHGEIGSAPRPGSMFRAAVEAAIATGPVSPQRHTFPSALERLHLARSTDEHIGLPIAPHAGLQVSGSTELRAGSIEGGDASSGKLRQALEEILQDLVTAHHANSMLMQRTLCALEAMDGNDSKHSPPEP